MFGIAPDHHVNLLGMTELVEPVLRQHPRFTRRTEAQGQSAVDSHTRNGSLHPRAAAGGEVGLLRYLDLANLDRPLVIQTDDLGRTVSGGFEVLGRAVNDAIEGAPLRWDALAHSEAS